MRMLRLSCLGSIFCLAFVAASAQQPSSTSAPTSVTSDPQAVALIRRSLSALTGSVPATDVTLTGTARRIAGPDDETGTAMVKATAIGDSAMELMFPSGPRIELRNHSGTPPAGSLPSDMPTAAATVARPVGVWSGPDGIAHPIAVHNLMADSTWFFPAFTLARLLSAPNCSLSYVADEPINGQTVIHISAVEQFQVPSAGVAQTASLMQHLSQIDLYFDPITLLPVALTFNLHADSNALIDIPTQILFIGYQTADGVRVPIRVQKYLNNSLVLDLVFTNVTLNTGLSETAFAIP